MNYAIPPAMNKSLHAVLVKTCTSRSDPLSPQLKCSTHCLTVPTPTAWSPSIFSCRGIQWHIFASYTLSYQMPHCQIAVWWMAPEGEQNVMECCWEGRGMTSTVIPPTSASDTMHQHKEIGGITFRETSIKKSSLNMQWDYSFQLAQKEQEDLLLEF